jgi:RNA polymerase sigma-70 factor (ECF subfamily)
MMSEEDMFTRVRNGEAGAEEELFNQFRPLLLRASQGFLGQYQDEAEDLVQDTFMVAYPKFKRFDFRLPFFSWLRQICLRLCYARLRSRNGVLRCLEDELDQYRLRLNVARVPSQNLEVQNEQRLGLLRELIKQLRPDSRQIIQLRNVHGMTYAQMQATLGISQPVLAQRLVSARTQIREILQRLPETGSSGYFPLAA